MPPCDHCPNSSDLEDPYVPYSVGRWWSYAALTYISQFRTGDTIPDGRARMLWEVELTCHWDIFG